MNLDSVFKDLVAVRKDEIVIATMSAGYLWPRYSTSDRDFCYIAPMGSAAAIGLGLALAMPDVRVWVLDGDGSLLMNLGVLVTIAERCPPNLVHVVLNNGIYAITGGQPVAGARTSRLTDIAAAAGIRNIFNVEGSAAWEAFLEKGIPSAGPVFANVHVESGYDKAVAHEYTQGEQAAKTQGGPGFHNLHALLHSTHQN
jgi:sulfopyruvate decarboxylase subunit beta